ncbi:hypothetical protein DL93DRAFT_2231935 [Clavulina sp. PMI_390]|nr:hypothetical protein DL93DRAFT_2231935 [Clavulina sp. PMI_390]
MSCIKKRVCPHHLFLLLSSDEKTRLAAMEASTSSPHFATGAGASTSRLDKLSQPSSSGYFDTTSSQLPIHQQLTSSTSIDRLRHSPAPGPPVVRTTTPTAPTELGRSASTTSAPVGQLSASSQAITAGAITQSSEAPPPSYAETFPRGAPNRAGSNPRPPPATHHGDGSEPGARAESDSIEQPGYPPMQAIFGLTTERTPGGPRTYYQCSEGLHEYETKLGVSSLDYLPPKAAHEREHHCCMG